MRHRPGAYRLKYQTQPLADGNPATRRLRTPDHSVVIHL